VSLDPPWLRCRPRLRKKTRTRLSQGVPGCPGACNPPCTLLLRNPHDLFVSFMSARTRGRERPPEGSAATSTGSTATRIRPIARQCPALVISAGDRALWCGTPVRDGRMGCGQRRELAAAMPAASSGDSLPGIHAPEGAQQVPGRCGVQDLERGRRALAQIVRRVRNSGVHASGPGPAARIQRGCRSPVGVPRASPCPLPRPLPGRRRTVTVAPQTLVSSPGQAQFHHHTACKRAQRPQAGRFRIDHCFPASAALPGFLVGARRRRSRT
jgi:hypothetical protein